MTLNNVVIKHSAYLWLKTVSLKPRIFILDKLSLKKQPNFKIPVPHIWNFSSFIKLVNLPIFPSKNSQSSFYWTAYRKVSIMFIDELEACCTGLDPFKIPKVWEFKSSYRRTKEVNLIAMSLTRKCIVQRSIKENMNKL